MTPAHHDLRRFLSVACVASALLACAGSHEPEDACRIALSMRDEALAEAQNDPPRCQSDADCVVFSSRVECGAVSLGDCGIIAHREVARRYAAMSVPDKVCRAVADSELGCWVGPACARTGSPVCLAGNCVSSPP